MQDYLTSCIKQFQYYKSLGEKTFSQIPEDKLFWRPDDESNSISMIVNHLSGNMESRWTDFLSTDGEKEWRNRDREFEDLIKTKKEMLEVWEKGWTCLFQTLSRLTSEHLHKEIFIRNMGHTVVEAINRQLAHYPYHIGQIVYLGKQIAKNDWNSLSIPKGHSKSYNREKFSKEKKRRHFTDDL